MKANRFFLLCMVLCISFRVYAQSFTVSDVKCVPNGTAKITFSLESNVVGSDGNFQIDLPDGVSVDGTVSTGTVKTITTAIEKGTLLTQSNSVVMSNPSGSTYRVMITDLTGGEFAGKSGTLFTLPLKIGSLKDGEYTIKVSDIHFNDSQANGITENSGYFDDVTANLLVGSTVTGIDHILIDKEAADGKVYNLQGQQVSNTDQGGIYIINGKKVIVK